MLLVLAFSSGVINNLFADAISGPELNVIPYPRQVKTGGDDFIINGQLTIVLDKNPSAADKFAAEELIRDLKLEFNISSAIGVMGAEQTVVLTHKGVPGSVTKQGYMLTSGKKELIICNYLMREMSNE